MPNHPGVSVWEVESDESNIVFKLEVYLHGQTVVVFILSRACLLSFSCDIAFLVGNVVANKKPVAVFILIFLEGECDRADSI